MRMSVGAKLILGFSAVIGISLIVGLLVVINLFGVQANANNLDEKLLPSTALANNLERESLGLRYAVRGYALSEKAAFNEEAQRISEIMQKHLEEADSMVRKYPELVVFAENLSKLKSAQAGYASEVLRTHENLEKIKAGRLLLEENQGEFVKNITDYITSQNEAFLSEIRRNANVATLIERFNKTAWMNTVIDLGNLVIIATQQAQLLNDFTLITKAVEKFEPVYGLITQTLSVTRQAVNIAHLNKVAESARTYISVANEIAELYKEKEEIRLARENIGNEALTAVQAVSTLSINDAITGGKISQTQAAQSVMLLILGVLVSLVLGIIFALALTRSITGPLKQVTELSRAVTLGDLNIEKVSTSSRDELGDLIRGFQEMLDVFQYKAKLLETIAGGDLRDEVKLASEKDGLGHSIRAMQNSLNEVLRSVNTAVVQMAAGSDQVSQASQNLSQGATEQAASLEEISASTAEVSGQSRQNAENAKTASHMARNAAESAKKGRDQMGQLSKVMDQIAKSGTETKKIVKAIDDIAFQVNLLALNANVEAARAGKYGKGFAVVAEEVRALAVRSASAVKETTEMVEGTIASIEIGTKNVHATNEQFGEIVEEAGKVADLLEEIAAASQEQAKGMNQISMGLEQVDQVTQSNTASAEETASASEELSGQAQQLKVMVGRFQLKNSGAAFTQANQPETRHLIGAHTQSSNKPRSIKPVESRSGLGNTKPVIDLDDGDFSNF